MKRYAAPWEGRVILACRKCQKKIGKHGGPEGLAHLKQAVKARNRGRKEGLLHVIQVPCMDFCPKKAVAVCVPGAAGSCVVMLRGVEELEALAEI